MKTILLLIFIGFSTLVQSQEVTLADVSKAYLEREESMAKKVADARAQLPANATPNDLVEVGSPLRNTALFHLRYLTHLERTLRMLVIDDATRKEQLASEHLPSGEEGRIAKMWVELKAERFLQLAPPKDEKKSRRRGGNDSVEADLNDRFKSKSNSIARKIESTQRKLDTAYSKDRQDDRLIDSLDKEIDVLKSQLEELKIAYFGSDGSDGFEGPYEASGEAPAQKLLVDVVKSRDSLLSILRGQVPLKKEEGKKSGTIGDITFESESLGVILDISGSMTKFIDPLKEDIENDFSEPHYREARGCALAWSLKPISTKSDSSMLAIEDLLIVLQTDAIFWFSDLNDAQSPQALARLKWLFDTSGAGFYVNSVKNKPSRDLEALVTEFEKK